MAGLSMSSSNENGTCVIALRGELDLATAPRLNVEIDTAMQANPSKLVLDVAEVTFVDSAGLNTFVWAKRRGAGVPVVLHRASEQCRQLLAITGLGQEFELTE